MTDDQIIALARKHGFLGAFDIVIDRDLAIQFARLVIEAYDKIREADAC
jgi:hypothetical protein